MSANLCFPLSCKCSSAKIFSLVDISQLYPQNLICSNCNKEFHLERPFPYIFMEIDGFPLDTRSSEHKTGMTIVINAQMDFLSHLLDLICQSKKSKRFAERLYAENLKFHPSEAFHLLETGEDIEFLLQSQDHFDLYPSEERNHLIEVCSQEVVFEVSAYLKGQKEEQERNYRSVSLLSRDIERVKELLL